MRQKGIKKKWLSLKYAFMVKIKWKMKVGATKIQPDSSGGKEIRKRG